MKGLQVACNQGRTSIVKLFLELEGLRRLETDQIMTETPDLLATVCYGDNPSVSILNLLLNHGFEKYLSLRFLLCSCITILTFELKSKESKAVNNRLLETSIDIHEMDERYFRSACQFNNIWLIKKLLKYNNRRRINVHANNEEGFSWICKNKNYKLLRILLKLSGPDRIELTKCSDLIRNDFKIQCIIIEVIRQKIRRRRRTKSMLTEIMTVIRNRRKVVVELRLMPGGQDYYRVQDSFQAFLKELNPE